MGQPGDSDYAVALAISSPNVDEALALPEIIDIALKNNPQTRKSWAIARAAAAEYGEAEGAYYPDVMVGADIVGQRGLYQGGSKFYKNIELGPTASLSYLLFDFGGRQAQVDLAWQALLASNWEHNQQLQNIVFEVTIAYYLLIGKIADLDAADANLEEAEVSLDSAERRLQLGVGTRPDVLLVRARRAQRLLDVINMQGEVAIAQGQLATAMGYSAETTVAVAKPKQKPQADVSEVEITNLIQKALKQRPQMAAAWANLRSSEAAVVNAKSNLLPTVNFGAGAGWRNVYGQGFQHNGPLYAGTVSIDYPIFEGFALRNQVRKMEAQADVMRANVESQQQFIIQQVWNAYQNMLTANQRIHASLDLLQSAELSYAAALIAYRDGVSEIVELLQAQSTLAMARSEFVDANTLWYVALAQLTHAMGQEEGGG